MLKLPILTIKNAQKLGAKLLVEAGIEPEPAGVALAVEKHRWAWRPKQVKVILIAESHIYTSASDFALQICRENLPLNARNTPLEFVRLIYCLGYGEPKLLSGKTVQRNTGTRQFWDLFGRLAETGKQPRGGQKIWWQNRLSWKVDTLIKLCSKGIWVLDASFHAMYAPGGMRIPNKLKFALHQLWWEKYGSNLLAEFPTAKIWIIGKTVADDFQKLQINFDGWIYQPGAGRSSSRNLEQGWTELLNDVN
ncbi:MAG: hypothetical protein SAJ37_04335 [Oscillatoria sp. PMC 1068.18]|nr:hypothetical protein [Oscillatoria sp. PMC 1076.18]MEC4987956.1 hypothetical protein [Oscillatoria sp. PMC 1068.18]